MALFGVWVPGKVSWNRLGREELSLEHAAEEPMAVCGTPPLIEL